MFVEFLDTNAVNKSAACPKCGETEPLYTLWSTADWLCCDILPRCGDLSQPGAEQNVSLSMRCLHIMMIFLPSQARDKAE
jgi:hypothetical protein